MKFQMGRKYGSKQTLDTDDLLTAIKMTTNYEGDLYANGRLIMSCLGLSREENTIRLLKRGVTSYLNKLTQSWVYKYTDESKNKNKFYLNLYAHVWNGENKIVFTVHDYLSCREKVEFNSIGEVFEYVRLHVAHYNYDPKNVQLTIYCDYFSCAIAEPEDWAIEGEPLLYELHRDGKVMGCGFYHMLHKTLEAFEKRGSNMKLIPHKFEAEDLPF